MQKTELPNCKFKRSEMRIKMIQMKMKKIQRRIRKFREFAIEAKLVAKWE